MYCFKPSLELSRRDFILQFQTHPEDEFQNQKKPQRVEEWATEHTHIEYQFLGFPV